MWKQELIKLIWFRNFCIFVLQIGSLCVIISTWIQILVGLSSFSFHLFAFRFDLNLFFYRSNQFYIWLIDLYSVFFPFLTKYINLEHYYLEPFIELKGLRLTANTILIRVKLFCSLTSCCLDSITQNNSSSSYLSRLVRAFSTTFISRLLWKLGLRHFKKSPLVWPKWKISNDWPLR